MLAGQLLLDLVEAGGGLLGVGAGERADELVAAVAHHGVERAQPVAHGGDDRLEQRVPCVVAVAVVERLQLVDVDEGQDEPAVAPAGAVDLVLERDLAHLAPQRAGEVVVVGVAELDGGARAILGRRGTVGGGARTVGGRAGAVVRRPRAQRGQALRRGLLRAVRHGRGLEGLGGLVALHRRLVAGACRQVALVGGAEPFGRRARALRRRGEPLVGRLAAVLLARPCTWPCVRASGASCSRSAAA